MADPQKIAAMARDGYSLREIAAHFGVSAATISRIIKRSPSAPDDLDAPLLPTSPRMTPGVLRAEVVHLLRQGYDPVTIAKRLGVSRATVYRAMP